MQFRTFSMSSCGEPFFSAWVAYGLPTCVCVAGRGNGYHKSQIPWLPKDGAMKQLISTHGRGDCDESEIVHPHPCKLVFGREESERMGRRELFRDRYLTRRGRNYTEECVLVTSREGRNTR